MTFYQLIIFQEFGCTSEQGGNVGVLQYIDSQVAVIKNISRAFVDASVLQLGQVETRKLYRSICNPSPQVLYTIHNCYCLLPNIGPLMFLASILTLVWFGQFFRHDAPCPVTFFSSGEHRDADISTAIEIESQISIFQDIKALENGEFGPYIVLISPDLFR